MTTNAIEDYLRTLYEHKDASGVSHQPGAADVDVAFFNPFFNPFFNDQRSDSLDIPSLRGLRFTAPYGSDGRFESLREFSCNVIVNEFGGWGKRSVRWLPSGWACWQR